MKIQKRLLSLLLVGLMIFSLAACTDKNGSVWENATYTEDKTFGEGEKTITVKVTAEEKSVTFTIKTDKETLGDALIEHSLVEGESGQFGLYIKKVNGITADYDIDGTWWGISKDGVDLLTGADSESISGSESYIIERKK